MIETTAKKSTTRRAQPKPDALHLVMTEARAEARTLTELPKDLIGGHHPHRAAEVYRSRSGDWDLINRRRAQVGTGGVDGLIVQAAFAAFSTQDTVQVREGLLRLAALAGAAVERIDKAAA
ncbi:hypothetical protein [Kitasatospora sp. NPDC059800]|uniref:hypothetical protein n=1 Tax=Kitasatospora sp. NPDC059800 TaxID=3346951 RepID=UPI00365A6DB5